MDLCRYVFVGFREQLRRDGVWSRASAGMQHYSCINICESIDDAQNDDLAREYVCAMDGKDCVDDMTGQPLHPVLVEDVKAKDFDDLVQKEVRFLKPVTEARMKTGRPPISVRWVCTNKGDNQNPNVRAGLVAWQIRNAGKCPLLAPSSPLEALRSVLSMFATDFEHDGPKDRWPESEGRWQVSFMDMSRAYVYAKADPDKPTCCTSHRAPSA